MSRISRVFALNREGLNVRRGLEALAVLLVPFVVLTALGDQKYLLSVIFGVVFVALSDPGGDYRDRLGTMVGVALAGAALTALAFTLGTAAWGWIVLATFAVTLVAGLAMRFGLQRFVAAELLNVWFLLALGIPIANKAAHVTTTAGSQTLAWLVGAALWIAATGIGWIVRGRGPVASHFPEIPSDTSAVELTRPRILFAVIRAVALSISVAIAYGFALPNADWMSIATLVAMKSDLQQSELASVQRLVGAAIGAAVAALFLVSIANRHVLGLAIIVFAAAAACIRSLNYALYCAAVAAAVLIAMDLPHPTDFSDEAHRVIFTFIGLGIGLLIMLLANLIQKRTTERAATPA